MDRKNKNNSDENSLGILNMDSLQVFGDLSNNSAGKASKNRVSERLNAERLKALETLEKPRRSNAWNQSGQDKNLLGRNSTLLDRSNVMPRQHDSINISELITDDTINLNSSGSVLNTPAVPRDKISFEPAEITGRSTHYHHQHDRKTLNSTQSSSLNQSKRVISVGEILATSFAEKARKLSKHAPQQSSRYNLSHDQSSSLGSFNTSHSLPRTADLSRSNCTLNGGDGFSFGGASQKFDESNFSALADFAPGELMQSKLVLDEISWAQEFAAIPTATLSNQAKEKIEESAPHEMTDIEASMSNSLFANDSNFSVGSFFKKRSDSVVVFAGSKSPEKLRMPSALVENSELNSSASTASSGLLTPKVDNKTYTKVDSSKLDANILKKKALENQKDLDKTKKTSNTNNNSYLLSLSAIDRLLRNLDIDTDSSSADVVEKLMVHGHKPTLKGDEYFDNKENSDPTLNDDNLKHTDTMSFSESVLNSTDFRQLQQSISTPRTPLSPLFDQTTRPQITLTGSEEHDADVDEWPSSPLISPHRRKRRTKSPQGVSPSLQSETLKPEMSDDGDKTPVNKNKSILGNIRRPKSLCSTRLDGCESVPTTSDFGISPNHSKDVSLTLTNGLMQERRLISPLSSPRSCLSSPMLDSTTSSERRLLHPGSARKANSSPAASEAGSSCGIGAVVRKANTARSISRCSNSSEFSHRDGKTIPLKVTQLQLCWGSVKLRTDARKTMQVKNNGDKRLMVRIGIHGPGFQLVNTEGSNTLTLQSQECRTIAINFCPTVCGAAVGMLSFYSPHGTSNANISLHDIPLFGYGGNATITVHGLLKGPVGSCFLPLGDVCELPSGPLKTTFNIYNKGPLTAYANIAVDSTVLLKPRISDAFEVEPTKVIIPAGNEVTVTIKFKPSRDDIKNVVKKSTQVLTLANMRIICGDEPNRQRMRSLLQRMSKEERVKVTSAMLDSLWCTFPHEVEMDDLTLLKELPEFLLDFVAAVRIHDVALTLNRDFDETAEMSSIFFPEADETVLFRTICANNSPTPTQACLDPVDELLEANVATAGSATEQGSWSVKPATLKFNINNLQQSILFIKNSYKSRQYCEIACNVPSLLRFSPTEGYVLPDGGQLEVAVDAVPERIRDALKKEVVIMIYMENERINVPVKFNI